MDQVEIEKLIIICSTYMANLDSIKKLGESWWERFGEKSKEFIL